MNPHQSLAVLSDIHGNRWALEAVLQNIDRRSITRIVNLGDSLYGPLDPAGTADLLIERDIVSILGNEDRVLLTPDGECDAHQSLAFTLAQLEQKHLDWMQTQPFTTVIEDCFLCHGTPASDTQYLLTGIDETGSHLRDNPAITQLLTDIDAPVILCGHDHTARVVALPDGRLIVNPGSVGCPAYTDDQPHPHAMEAGSPHARYAVIHGDEAGWRVEQIALSYDWETAAQVAQQNGRPDWAHTQRTGRAN